VTTAEQLRDAVSRPASTISIAGVAWPAYKVFSLLIGLLVLVVVGVATASAGPAVLSAAGVTVVSWLTLGTAGRIR
jgi:hypothetical protein